MPNDSPNIILQVSATGQPAPWVMVSASNNSVYYYLYTGGDDGHGGMNVSKSRNPGARTAHVNLTADNRFQIFSVAFINDVNNQLTWNGSGNAGTIVDKNTVVQDAYYSISVIDTQNGNCTIGCDPGVKNIPLP